jgi:hypothetical protein
VSTDANCYRRAPDSQCLQGHIKVLPWVADRPDDEIEAMIRLEAEGMVDDMLRALPVWRMELAEAAE